MPPPATEAGAGRCGAPVGGGAEELELSGGGNGTGDTAAGWAVTGGGMGGGGDAAGCTRTGRGGGTSAR